MSPTASVTGKKTPEPDPYAVKIVWKNVIIFAILHYFAICGIYLFFTGQLHAYTYASFVALSLLANVGITGGAHRLWSHRSYKAKWPLRAMLMLMQTLSLQNDIHEWARDHRVHHKFTDTDADPHSISRGFFFAHMGWLLVRKHPDVRSKGATVSMSDLERDPIVMFQKKYYLYLVLLIAVVMPTVVPVMLWGESVWNAWCVCSVARYVINLHVTWCINSVAHMFGTRPIDKNTSSRQNMVLAYLTAGEGWHNYHHAFPWDYKAAEFGSPNGNLTAAFIDLFARVGWAYDLKTVSKEMIEKRVRRTGDGSHPFAGKAVDNNNAYDGAQQDHSGEVWGWGDKDMSQDDILGATIIQKGGVERPGNRLGVNSSSHSCENVLSRLSMF